MINETEPHKRFGFEPIPINTDIPFIKRVERELKSTNIYTSGRKKLRIFGSVIVDFDKYMCYLPFVTKYLSVVENNRDLLNLYFFNEVVGWVVGLRFYYHRHGEHGVLLRRIVDKNGLLWGLFGVDKPHSYYINSCMIFDRSHGYMEVEVDSFETLGKAYDRVLRSDLRGTPFFVNEMGCYSHGSGRNWMKIKS